ncbi:MAG: tRNA (adenosine(37)-N6)-threonylcarbamoyltransferase complex dimerization subunit type 1 TsaB [Armatimonadetes bacterium 55-13]|nr:tRNA (adenosine(37)-N6)-threonylcarbamoyltransferase complex dimerization subunit type 1 TsaB [Armatimonadota bacterium]OJU61643.1 MAG: tRNA (adenosine(37)-N6)-threonylcarbamoyltransferase complex dimerization subunit type 1 TsaB [Armatimonadetes bacterium 55-13]
MIVAFSTSSPYSSVALLSEDGEVMASRQVLAPMRASGACFRMLDEIWDESGAKLEDARLFACDLGPGSFTGVKVAVTIAKTLALCQGKLVTGATSFDLIDADQLVVMPSKRNEYFVRYPGKDAMRRSELPDDPFTGFGPGLTSEVYPHAERFATILDRCVIVEPERLTPNYLIEPSISKPKSPLNVVSEPCV